MAVAGWSGVAAGVGERAVVAVVGSVLPLC
ncbi:hypothetical protein HMPREF1211_03684, partial [Streptomyces sp. HGB0020]